MENTKRIVEVNGVKIEIDLRTAKRVDEFRVGSAVKVLLKDYSGYKSHFGMIVGFDEFKSLPTILVAYIEAGSWTTDPLKIAYVNAKTEGVEICAQDPNDIGLEKDDILKQFDRQITAKEQEILTLQQKRKYFVEMFGRYFEPVVENNVG